MESTRSSRSTTAPDVGPGPLLVGRESERQVLDALVAGARLGRGGVLVLTGEAGIGKTSLLQYAASAASATVHASGPAQGVRLLRALGSEAEHEVPFGGLSQLLRPTPAELDRIPAPQAQALGVALALRQGPVADRLAIGAAVLSLLVRYSEDQPVGVIVDDAHLLDRPSSEALAFACRRLLADPIFVLVAARPDPHDPLTAAGLPEVALGGLSLDATGALARAHGARPTTGTVAQLHRVTGGNPLAVRELAHDPDRLLTTAVLADTLGPAGTPVPAALSAWFGQRVTALGQPARTALLVAAIAGGDLPVVTRACAQLGTDVAALVAGERAGLVELRPGRLEFVHPLVQAAVYAISSPQERRSLHAVVADALPPADVDRRAWHRSEATIAPDDALAGEMVQVARRAVGRGAYAVAASAYDRAALLSTDDGSRAHRLLDAAEASWHAGDGERGTMLLAQAQALDTSAPLRARALGLHGDIACHRGSPAQAQSLFAAAATQVEASDPSRAVALLAEAINAGFIAGDADGVADAARRAELMLDRDLDPTATALGTLASGMARVLAGRPGAERVRTGVRLLEAAVDPDPGALPPAWLMFGPLYLREAGASRSLVRTALDTSRSQAAVGRLPGLLLLIARDGATTDRWAAAEADYAEAVDLAGELGQTTMLALSLAGLACLEARTGQVSACRAHAAQALALCDVHPLHTAWVWAQHALGELALTTGDVSGAIDTFTALEDRLVAIGRRDPDLSPAPERVEALLRTGRGEQARALADDYQARAAAKGLAWAMARAARTRGLLCPAQELDEHFGAALALHARTPDLFEQARTLLAYGARLRRARRRVEAREPLRAALAAFRRLGARPSAEAAAFELEATGETVRPPGRTGLESLTPRELQIALLLGEGRTTREAAAVLFLSPKTVEYHLRHVYTKLELTTRSQLVARVRADQGRLRADGSG